MIRLVYWLADEDRVCRIGITDISRLFKSTTQYQKNQFGVINVVKLAECLE